MDSLKYILDKYNIRNWGYEKLPLEIPNAGRDQMAELFAELGFKTGVEIGVRGGDYSEVLCQKIPNVVLFGVDPYEPHSGYRDIVKAETFNQFEIEAHRKLDKYPNYKFLKMYSMEALKEFADNSLDFVYLDGDHCFEEVTKDISGWLKKIKKGGIISGHDYYKHKGPARIHVYQVVNAFTDAWDIKPWFVWGTKAINPGEIRDHGRSWMWVKQ